MCRDYFVNYPYDESRARRLTGWKMFQLSTGNMKHHDQSCDHASQWTSVTCVATRSGLLHSIVSLSAYRIIELDVASVTVSS